MWSRTDPGAGDPDGIRRAAALRTDLADRIRQPVLTTAQQVRDEATGGGWAGEAADAFVSQLDQLDPVLRDLATRLDAEAAALDDYATKVEGIAADAAHLRRQQATTAAEIPRSDEQVVAFDAAQRRHDLEWDDLGTRRRQADADCVAALEPAPSAAVADLSGAQLDQLGDERLLQLLADVSPAELLVLLQENPALAGRIAAIHDPSAVAAWWASLGGSDDPALRGSAQLALVAAIPAALGNLDGISAWARDLANRSELDRQIADLESLRERTGDLPQQVGHYVDAAHGRLQKHGFLSTDQLDTYLASLRAIRTTLDAHGSLTYQLITFQPADLSRASGNTPKPLAAISVGDIDRATQVTVDVPGMGTTVHDSMASWTGAAANLYRQEAFLNSHSGGAESGLAVVSWIGYDTPDMPPSVQVWSMDKAQAGAERLSSFLGGVSASHGWEGGDNLSVVAHSYGTTTASLALTSTPVENFTMLASAGLDPSITSVNDLRVQPGHVWASEASGDWVADIGRGDSYVSYGPPPPPGSDPDFWIPNPDADPQWVATLPSSHPVNPTDAPFGAHVFSSQDATVSVDGSTQHLQGSDWHSATPHLEAVQAGDSPDEVRKAQYGYLDSGTTPLYNTAITSLGLEARDGVVR
ncbi:MAG TPA: alpha/beta hydrolase [Pseudolysinimonas sp.]|nr:alpha/beta hydrolase [Pseudolysinimonas sp.]